MDNRRELENRLFSNPTNDNSCSFAVYDYAENIAKVENCIVAVSDIHNHQTKIFLGNFAKELGLTDYSDESSIWERKILDMLTPEDQERKYLGELRFFNFVRLLPRMKRSQYFLVAKLQFKKNIDVLHRMHYIYDEHGEGVRYAVCRYERMWMNLPGKCMAVNSLTGRCEELTSDADNTILSKRERQVLTLIDEGKSSAEIAELLMISKHTVSRHRQSILTKLQVKNSYEACRTAKSLAII